MNPTAQPPQPEKDVKSSDTLTIEDQLLIANWRGGNFAAAAKMILDRNKDTPPLELLDIAIQAQSGELLMGFAEVIANGLSPKPSEQETLLNALRNAPPKEAYQRPAPPQHATWEEWTKGDYQQALNHDNAQDKEQLAAFLFGHLAISGAITRSQLKGETRKFILGDLEHGLDEAARLISFNGAKNIAELINQAEWGRAHKR